MLREALVVGLVVALVTAGASGAFIQDDFETGIGNWDGVWQRVDLGGNWVYQTSGDGAGSYNNTPLPAALQIDLDLARAGVNYTTVGLNILFHQDANWSIGTREGYYLEYLDDWGVAEDGLQLSRRDAAWGSFTLIAVANVPVDTNPHHVRITDDGPVGSRSTSTT